MTSAKAQEPLVEFGTRAEWEAWLDANHATRRGLWVKLSKKDAPVATVSRADVLELALCYGWIDGQAKSIDDHYWMQRFTPRTKRSRWSQVNRAAAEALIESGLMRAAGLAEVDAAKADGRWASAYAPPSRITVPDDLQRALDREPDAQRSFDSLDSRNRYAILYRIQDAKKPETRQRRIDNFVAMLVRGETIH
ncbi:MAG TPA: YdeI/OmpD-associated family protein [Longimicrobiales bacterium]|nr:YdeI/OmpD-associated family protein [Longimicrobiales bacterium]